MPNAKGVRPLFRRPTLLPAGVGTNYKGDPKDRLGIPDPTQWGTFFDDFDGNTGTETPTTLSAASNGWAAQIQTVGTGTFANKSQTTAPSTVTGAYGIFTHVSSAGGTDSTTLTRHATLGQSFVFDTARKFYMEWRLNVNTSPLLGNWAVGMIPASTTMAVGSMTEGFRLAKTSGVGTFDLKTFNNSATAVSTTSTLWNSAAMPASTFVTLGLAYNGVAYGPGSFLPTGVVATVVNFEIVVYIDLNDGNGYRQQAIPLPATSLPRATVGLMPAFTYIETTAAARTVDIDYVFVAQDRFNV
jgi:hypothetical protein